MAAILKLSDGTVTVDFQDAVGDYTLLKEGLTIDLPEINRITGGDPLLSEGERLQDRQYGNREIGIKFKIEAADHDTLIRDIRRINQLIDSAKRTASEIFGAKVELNYKFDNATDEVVFIVLDGELELPRIASTTAHRDSLMLDCELTLICKPFAHLSSILEITNELINPGFDWGPGELGRDAGRYIIIDSSAKRLERTSPTGLFSAGAPPIMSYGIWVRLNTTGATKQVVRCGEATISWEIQISSVNNVTLIWYETDNTQHIITADNLSLLANTWYFISFTIISPIGTDALTILMVNDQVQKTLRTTSSLAMRSPSGVFVMGAKSDGTLDLDGRMAGAFLITGKQLMSYQLIYLYYYGLRSLVEAAAIMTEDYWGFETADYGAVWPFDESAGDLLDKSGNSRDLTVVGSPTRTVNVRTPNGWTIGSGLADSDLHIADKMHGIASMKIKETTPTNGHIDQTIGGTSGKNVTVIFWVKGTSGSVRATVGSVAASISPPAGSWSQWIRTFDSPASGLIRIGVQDATSAEYLLDSAQYIIGKPYGTFSSWTNVTANPKASVGSKFLRAFPDVTKVFWLDTYDIPGDVPAACKVIVKNPDAATKGPIKIGALRGRNPWKQFLAWRASTWTPDYANGSDFDVSTPTNPSITAAAAVTILDRFFTSLARLYPFPDSQRGSYKVYVGADGELNLLSFLRRISLTSTIALTGDPVKDTNAAVANVHMVDGGILSWPPESALEDFRQGRVSSAPRKKLDAFTPKLTVANIADAVIAAPNIDYRHIYLLPIEGGFFSLAPLGTTAEDGLQQNELLIIDTIDIDEGAIQPGYLAKEITTPIDTSAVRRLLLNTPDLSMFGAGFRLEPNQSGMFTFLTTDIGSGDSPFGKFVETALLEVSLQIQPRFLYV